MPILVTSNLLTNQLRRDSLIIAKSFDELCGSDLEEMSTLLSQGCAVLLSASGNHGNLSNVQTWAIEVLLNVSNSLSAAAYVLRAGHMLIPGVILRNSVEAMAVCLHGLQVQEDLPKIRSGDFDTPRAISIAKKVIPPFGLIYGMLSELFTHISPLHQKTKPLVPFTERHVGLVMNLKTLRAAIWLFYVVVEFAFINHIAATARYWKIAKPGVAEYNPSPEERTWLMSYLEPDKDKDQA